jgi:hypothetical protein
LRYLQHRTIGIDELAQRYRQSGHRKLPRVAAIDPADLPLTEAVAQQVLSPDRVAVQRDEIMVEGRRMFLSSRLKSRIDK